MENENNLIFIQSLPVMALILLLLCVGVSQCECSSTKTDDDLPIVSENFDAVEDGISAAEGIVTRTGFVLDECRSELAAGRTAIERAREEQCDIANHLAAIEELFDSCTE